VAIGYHQNADMARQLQDELTGMGVGACVVQADVGDEESVFAMRDAIRAELGDPDILVNNAVAQYPWKAVLEQPLDDYRGQFRSCVLQNVLMAKAFAPAMISRRWGRIIAINTECSVQCTPGQSAYVSGKKGMDGVLRVLAREIGPHQVTVNQVAPGWMVSDKYRGTGLHADYDTEYRDRVPLKRRGEDQDIANAVAFLASDLANFITGVYLPVCGGNIMTGI
jgi:3-oxoacyl-[acyl-carrier protein] reductase